MNISIKNLISEPHCVFCNKRLDLTAKDCLCQKCRSSLPYVKGNLCKNCSRPLPKGYTADICRDCKGTRYNFLHNVSALKYSGVVEDAIKRMKFTSLEIWIAHELGKILSETVLKEYNDIKFDMIVPVPISQINYVKRRFNQAEEISLMIKNILNISLNTNNLIKFKHTSQQSSLGYHQRKTNVKGAYKVIKPDEFTDKTILLIDDVFTTGSTINECAKMLKKAGAACVYTATVAIVAYDD